MNKLPIDDHAGNPPAGNGGGVRPCSPLRKAAIAGVTLLMTPVAALLSAALLTRNAVREVFQRAIRPAPGRKPLSGLASIVILNWNGKDLLGRCLPSVIDAIQLDGQPHEIMVVDDGSDDGSAAYVRATFPQVRVIELPQNGGFAAGNNAGVRAAQHDIVVLLNNDMIVDRGFLRPLLDGFGPDTFAVSSQIRNQNPASVREETGRTVVRFRRGFIDFSHRQIHEGSLLYHPVFWAGGGSSAFHRERFLMLGGFHEAYSPAYVEDADLSFQAWRAGWEVLYAPASLVYHEHRATSSRRFAPRDLQRLILRNQFLFHWKNLRSWKLLMQHCAFMPWNCYRLARDHGIGIWSSLFRATARIHGIRDAGYRVRRDCEIFEQFAGRALQPSHGRGARLAERGAPPRILWMTPYLPYLGRHAGAGRMFHLLTRIARQYRVTLLSFLEDEQEREYLPGLEAICEQVIAMPRMPPARWQPFACEPFKQFLVPEMQDALQRCIESRGYDLIQLEYTQMAEYADKNLGIPTLLTKHEVDFAACRRRVQVETNPLRKLWWFYNYLQVLDREVSLTRRVDAAICVTEPDRQEFKRFCSSVPAHVVNTGVDLDYFSPQTRAAGGDRMIFVGAFQHEPNVDAMTYFCGQVLPRIRAGIPAAELVIVGSNPPPRIRALAGIPGVQVTGYVPDIRPLMAEASVYVVPLRLGVGIRGKILEAWGMALPVVATSVAGAGLRHVHNKNLLIADTPADFAACVVKLLKDPACRRSMGLAARKSAEEFYGWDALASELGTIYRQYMPASAAQRAWGRSAN